MYQYQCEGKLLKRYAVYRDLPGSKNMVIHISFNWCMYLKGFRYAGI